MAIDRTFWQERSVFLTGHTGFKGAWLTLWLGSLGARVTGFSIGVPTVPSLYELTGAEAGITALEGDIRDFGAVSDALRTSEAEVVIHMAAQPLVRRSFRFPRETYDTNVMGTVNVLEAARQSPGMRVIVNVTSDKCYDNRGQGRPFVEDDPMGGHDPYSSSKACAELVTDAFRRSFDMRLVSARAGNVIGGGDWGEDRLIPDIMRGVVSRTVIPVRNPDAVRPWQHVLNPLSGYLELVQALWDDGAFAGSWNFGPALADARPVQAIADRLAELWPDCLRWQVDSGPHPHEAGYLALDSTKARTQLGWAPAWGLDETLASIVDWYRAWLAGEDIRSVTLGQIKSFEAAAAGADHR